MGGVSAGGGVLWLSGRYDAEVFLCHGTPRSDLEYFQTISRYRC